MTEVKTHHNKGNQYAAKSEEDKKDATIQLRVKRSEKADFVRNLKPYEKLSDLMLTATRKEIERRKAENK